MHDQSNLSLLGQNAGTPAISDLMRLALARPELISLAAGFVDQQSLPLNTIEQAWRSIMADPKAGREALQYGTTQGDPVLRYALAQRLQDESPSLNVTVSSIAERIMITTGSQQLLYLLAEALINPGDIVITEAPTYFVFLDLLKARGAEIIGIPIDEGGLCTVKLENALARVHSEGRLSRVKMIYTVTEHSNPSGLSMADDRREKVVALARVYSQNQKIYVVDDAAYRGLGFDETEPASLWSHDRSGDWVIHARTFSKTFSPGVKLGYGVLPEDLLPAVLALKGHHDFGTSNLMQRLILQVLESGQFKVQMERLRAIYKAKCTALLETLEYRLGDLKPEVQWTVPKGGLYVWLTLPESIETSRNGDFFAACIDAGVFYVPGEYCFPAIVESGERSKNQIRLCYGVPNEATIREGVHRLSKVVRSFVAPVGQPA